MLGVETTVVLILRGNEGNWCESRQDPQAQSSLLSCWAFHLASDGGILPQVLLVEGQIPLAVVDASQVGKRSELSEVRNRMELVAGMAGLWLLSNSAGQTAVSERIPSGEPNSWSVPIYSYSSLTVRSHLRLDDYLDDFQMFTSVYLHHMEMALLEFQSCSATPC